MPEDNPYVAPQSQIVPPPPLPSDQVAKALTGLQYPLTLSFKILALTTQANVTDASGRTVLHTKQKFFKFKEHVEIFADSTRSTRLADIKTNKVIDSPRYSMKPLSNSSTRPKQKSLEPQQQPASSLPSPQTLPDKALIETRLQTATKAKAEFWRNP